MSELTLQSPISESVSESVNGASERIEELGGAEVGSTWETETGEEGEASDHTPVSSPAGGPTAQPSGPSDEASVDGSQSFHETVPGWTESSVSETNAQVEATVDASQAETGEEFFQFLAPLILPIAKAVLPQLAGAAAQAGSSALRNLINSRVMRVRRRIAGRREAEIEFGGDESVLVAEAAAETLAQLEVVIGTDDRVRITNTQAQPWNRVCHLRITAANGSTFLGTGFLIGRRTVVTAGHCVFLHNNGGWARSIEVTPGRNGDSRPFGRATATAFRSVIGWTVRRKRVCDYGVIMLPQAPSPFPGSFGVRSPLNAELQNKRLNTAGYPGDKAQALPGSMWFHGRRATSVTSTVITYDIDTAGGQSGSPVWIKTPDGQRYVVGIHTNGAPSGNSATRITAQILANLRLWNEASQ